MNCDKQQGAEESIIPDKFKEQHLSNCGACKSNLSIQMDKFKEHSVAHANQIC